MADRPSDAERLALVENLLFSLITGSRPGEPNSEGDLYRQQILGAIVQQLRNGDQTPPRQAFWICEGPLLSNISGINQQVLYLERRADKIEETQRELLLALSLSPAFAEVPFRRVVPAFIYISIDEEEIGLELEARLTEIADGIGLEIFYVGSAERSSWFRDLLARTRGALTEEQVRQGLGKVERALELKHLDSVQAKADLDISKAAKNISEILAKVPEGIVCLGSITGIKTAGGSLVIMTLTQEEMLQVAKDPSLKKSPDKLLNLLTRHRCASDSKGPLTIDARGSESASIAKRNKKKRPKSPPPPTTLDS